MLAKCISNNVEIFRGNADFSKFLGFGSASSSHAPLVIGQEYLVVAFAFGPLVPWLFVADRLGLRYPLIYPSYMFSITDTRISRSWEQCLWLDARGGKSMMLAPHVFAEFPEFPGMALEGNPDALSKFSNLVSFMSLEFSLPWVEEHAVILNEGFWVADADFSESWQADPSNEMTVRPSTGALLHNPLCKHQL